MGMIIRDDNGHKVKGLTTTEYKRMYGLCEQIIEAAKEVVRLGGGKVKIMYDQNSETVKEVKNGSRI